jgi:hypothetical protein
MLRQRADCEAMSEEQPEAEDGQLHLFPEGVMHADQS